LSSAVATAQFAVYKFLQGATAGFYGCQAFLSVTVFVATLLLYLSMLQNRLYFVYIARQINAIRGYLMESAAGSFKSNQLYTVTNFSALKLSSIHTFQLLGAALISAMFACLATFAIYPAFGESPCIIASVIVFVLVGAAEIVGGIKYLTATDNRTADDAMHGKNKSESGKGESFSPPPHTT
jgi:hypothetical protein